MVSPPSMAGLPAPRAIVCVGPPLFASGPRRGLATVIPVQVESPNWRLCPPVKGIPENEQLPPLLLAMMVSVTAVTGVRPPKATAPPDAAAVLPAMVQLVIVTGAAERFSADPWPPAPEVLPVKVSFEIVTLLPLLRFSTPIAPPPKVPALPVNVERSIDMMTLKVELLKISMAPETDAVFPLNVESATDAS